MKQRLDGISNAQIVLTISSAITGVTVLSLPRIASEAAGADGVIAILIAGMVSLFMLALLIKLADRFPKDTIIEYSSKLITPILGKVAGVGLFIYLLGVSGTVLRNFADVIKGFILRQTPLEVIMIVFTLTVLYMVLKGILTIAKICELFEPMIIAALSLLIILSFKNFNAENIYPMFDKGIKPFLRGTFDLMPVFLGYEILLFIFPFARNRSMVLKYSLIGFLIPLLTFFSLVLVAIGVYSANATERSLYPTLQLAKYIVFPGAFAERFDIFFIIFWIFASFTTMSIYYYLASLSITRVLGLRNYKPIAVLILPFVFLIGILPQNILQILEVTKRIGLVGLGVLAFSLILLATAFLLRKKEE